MHDKFPEWLTIARPHLTNEIVSARVAMIEKITTGLATEHVIDLVRYVSRGGNETPPFYLQALRGADASFAISDAVAETRVLAAATLVELIERNLAAADIAAMAVVCAALGGLRTIGPVHDLLMCAERHVFRKGRDIRAARTPKNFAVPDLKKALTEVTESLNVLNQAGFNQLKEFLPKAVDGQVSLTKATNKAISTLSSMVASIREQLDISWWVFGGTLNAGVRFSDLKAPELAFWIAAELEEMTQQVPGPVGLRAFIDVAMSVNGRKIAPVTLRKAVASAPVEIVESVKRLATSSLEYLCPLTVALYRRQTAPGAWEQAFESEMDVKLAAAMTPAVIAYQLYSERLLLRLA